MISKHFVEESAQAFARELGLKGEQAREFVDEARRIHQAASKELFMFACGLKRAA